MTWVHEAREGFPWNLVENRGLGWESMTDADIRVQMRYVHSSLAMGYHRPWLPVVICRVSSFDSTVIWRHLNANEEERA